MSLIKNVRSNQQKKMQRRLKWANEAQKRAIVSQGQRYTLVIEESVNDTHL